MLKRGDSYAKLFQRRSRTATIDSIVTWFQSEQTGIKCSMVIRAKNQSIPGIVRTAVFLWDHMSGIE